jgi:translation initiation factor 1 (eIF-1/SUI1)
MQALFGCGATQKDGIIELRGDMRPKVESYCAERDLKVVRAGG